MKLLSVIALLGISAFSFSITSQSLKVEAENYTSMFEVKSHETSDSGGGTDIGLLKSEDWSSYSVIIPSSGYYKVEYRVSGLKTLGEISLRKDKKELTTTVFGPNNDWQIITAFVYLTQGQQTLVLYIKTGGFYLNWWQLTAVNDKNDREKPTSPVNLKVASSDASLAISWDASRDNIGVVGYNVYLNENKIGTTTTTTYHVDLLKADSNYSIGIESYDTRGNLSAKAYIKAKTNIAPTLIWSDEFNYNGLPDSTKWAYDNPYAGNSNLELQYYTQGEIKNSRVVNGSLIIEALNDTVGGKNYTSARLITDKKASWLYGKFEVRAKIPVSLGSWPAIWMMPSDAAYGGWPSSGEIDIMEHVGWDVGNIHTTLHFQDRNGINKQHPTSRKAIENVNTEFHLYSFLWFPDRMEWYIDNQWAFTYSNPNTGWKSWPYNKPFYLILNVAVGGVWGGQEGIDEKSFPQNMEIDYVRVYDMHLGADTIAPAAPTNVSAMASATSANLSWDASIDNFGVKAYNIYSNGKLENSITSLNALVRGLTPETTYSYGIEARDYAGNLSSKSFYSFTTNKFLGVTIPAKIEAESFNAMTGIEVENCTDLGLGKNTGWIDPADWMEYYVTVTENNMFSVDMRVATMNPLGVAQIIDENDIVLATVKIPSTGGWQNWQTISSSKFLLTKGNHSLRIKCIEAGFNLNWLTFQL